MKYRKGGIKDPYWWSDHPSTFARPICTMPDWESGFVSAWVESVIIIFNKITYLPSKNWINHRLSIYVTASIHLDFFGRELHTRMWVYKVNTAMFLLILDKCQLKSNNHLVGPNFHCWHCLTCIAFKATQFGKVILYFGIV